MIARMRSGRAVPAQPVDRRNHGLYNAFLLNNTGLSMPLFAKIALRYTRAKQSKFISFISLASMIGIALGVAVLITVLSVMNGFDGQIRNHLFSLARQVTVTSPEGRIPDWERLQVTLQTIEHAQAIAPIIVGQGMLTTGIGQVQAVMVNGVDPEKEKIVSNLPEKMKLGHLEDLVPGEFGMIIGRQLAMNLGLVVGDKVNLLIPKASITPLGALPVYKRFQIKGIFEVGHGFGFDTSWAYIHLNDAQKLYNLGNTVTAVQLKLDNFYKAFDVARNIETQLPKYYYVSTWMDEYGALFDAIKLEKTMMFLILLLIIAVAAFNLVSSIVMLINDKKSEIAILRTLGATPKMVFKIFMTQGSFIGFFGTFLGLIGGILLALNVTEIVNGIESLLGIKLLSSSVYYVNYLPSKLMASDVIKIVSAALIMSFLSTLYPAWRATKIDPAEALRYE